MSLNVYSGIGNISSKEYKQVGERWVCNINVPVNIFIKGRNGNEDREETLWFELAAWGSPSDKFDRAAYWNDKFEKGMKVSITGNPRPRLYTNKSTGEPGFSLLLDNAQISEIKLGGKKDGGSEGGQATEEMPF